MSKPKSPYKIISEHQKHLPVNLIKLAEALGAKVWQTNEWDESVSGMVRQDSERGGSEGYAIVVNAKHKDIDKRFTIAHEIAHLALHKDLIGDGITNDALYHKGIDSLLEQMMNNTAIDILMPWNAVTKKIDDGMTNIGELAEFFNVSRRAMSVRLSVPYESNEEDLAD